MINLLIIVSNRVGKGTYWRSAMFARELVRLGYNVTIMAVSPARRIGFSETVHNGFCLVETPDLLPSSGYDPWDTICRIRWLRGRSFDLVHAFESRPVTIGPALYLKRKMHIPLVLDWCDWFGRGGSVEERTNPFIRHLLRPVETYFEENFRTCADGTTVINSLLRSKAISLGVPENTVLDLPNAVDVDHYKEMDMAPLRKRLGLPAGSTILGYTGAMFQSDGKLMAESFERIHKAHPDVRLLLIGYVNIEIEKWMTNAVKAVIRTGRLSYSDMARYVAACDIGWLALKNTGANRGRFPFKILDFMSASRPLMSTDVGDYGKLVKDKGVGVVAVDEPEEICRQTIRLIRDKELQHVLGARGRKLAETEFAIPVVTEKLHQFYTRILDRL